jgi:hypothetical protein
MTELRIHLASWRNQAITVRRDSAAKLVDGLAGESPASADYPVGTVVISGDGAGDQTVGSPDVNVLVGRTESESWDCRQRKYFCSTVLRELEKHIRCITWRALFRDKRRW